jgi:energy-coupling factor transporter ATP-binding protein EcfA2
MLTIRSVSLTVGSASISVPDSITLLPGNVYLVFGDSQSGASEFLQLIGGLGDLVTSSEPASNGRLIRTAAPIQTDRLKEVIFNGQPLYELPNRKRASYIGIVFENPEWSLLGGTVLEEFLFSFSASGSDFPPQYRLRPYGLYDHRDQRPETLSGGEMQRLNCATVLEGERRVIIADFSSSNLDRGFMSDFLKWIFQKSEEGAIAVVYGLSSSQLPPSVVPLYIDSGVVRFSDPPDGKFPSPEEEKILLKNRINRQSMLNAGSQVLSIEDLQGEYTKYPFSCDLFLSEILVIEGPNGCGKTTIGTMLMERSKPFKGEYDLFSSAPAMAFQHPEHCFFADTVFAELPDPELLETMHIAKELWYQHPRNLSKAQQKLLGVGVALSLSVDFGILDEPTCGMDHAAKLLFIDILNYFPGLAVLVFTHDASLLGLGRVVNFIGDGDQE